jgi:hypothetical protein
MQVAENPCLYVDWYGVEVCQAYLMAGNFAGRVHGYAMVLHILITLIYLKYAKPLLSHKLSQFLSTTPNSAILTGDFVAQSIQQHR